MKLTKWVMLVVLFVSMLFLSERSFSDQTFLVKLDDKKAGDEIFSYKTDKKDTNVVIFSSKTKISMEGMGVSIEQEEKLNKKSYAFSEYQLKADIAGQYQEMEAKVEGDSIKASVFANMQEYEKKVSYRESHVVLGLQTLSVYFYQILLNRYDFNKKGTQQFYAYLPDKLSEGPLKITFKEKCPAKLKEQEFQADHLEAVLVSLVINIWAKSDDHQLLKVDIPLMKFESSLPEFSITEQETVSATPKSDDRTAIAKEFVELLAKGDFVGAVKHFDNAMKEAAPPEKLREIWNSLVQQFGAFKKQVAVRTEKVQQSDIVFVTCEFENSNLDIKLPFNSAKEIVGFFIVPTPAQKSSEPVPYKEEEVQIQNGKVALAGTLTLPPKAGRHPAVVMITGSGAQNRDEEIFGFKPFKIIADNLTRNGIAVLRCDDRGVGGSNGPVMEATSEDFAGDVLVQVKFLQSRPDIDSKQIGLCGHSEGGIIAPMVASHSKDVAFIILLSGTGVTGDKVLLAQGQLIGKAEGATDEELKEQAEFHHRMFDAVRTGEGWAELGIYTRNMMLKKVQGLPDEQRKALGDINQFADSEVKKQLESVKIPWFKFFLDYDPSVDLDKVTCPVLALFGEIDLQVPAEMNKEAMERALKKGGNRDYTIKVIPKANHLYQAAVTGSFSEYSTLKKEFVPGFLDLITNWVLERVKVVK
jgi:uncharacterized protein